MEGNDAYGLDVFYLCLVPDTIIPPKFKKPNFKKYKRISCLKTHLMMYYRKMTEYSHNYKLLIHYFQDILNGASLEWYMQLKQSHVHTWKDLAKELLSITNTTWIWLRTTLNCKILLRGVISRSTIRPKIEMVGCSRSTTNVEYIANWYFYGYPARTYLKRMIYSMLSSFSDLVIAGERIESMLKSGKIKDASSS